MTEDSCGQPTVGRSPHLSVLKVAAFFYNVFHFRHDPLVAAVGMRHEAVGAVFDAAVFYEIAAALVLEHIQWAIAEQTVKAVRVLGFVAGKIFTFFILKKFKVLAVHLILHKIFCGYYNILI